MNKNGTQTQTETEILHGVRDLLRLEGFFVVRHQQNLGSHRGMSDITAIRDGRTLYIELKTLKGIMSDWQIKFKQDIETHGGIYLVIRSVDEMIDWLKDNNELRNMRLL